MLWIRWIGIFLGLLGLDFFLMPILKLPHDNAILHILELLCFIYVLGSIWKFSRESLVYLYIWFKWLQIRIWFSRPWMPIRIRCHVDPSGIRIHNSEFLCCCRFGFIPL
jgi:hypothetical protein